MFAISMQQKCNVPLTWEISCGLENSVKSSLASIKKCSQGLNGTEKGSISAPRTTLTVAHEASRAPLWSVIFSFGILVSSTCSLVYVHSSCFCIFEQKSHPRHSVTVSNLSCNSSGQNLSNHNQELLPPAPDPYLWFTVDNLRYLRRHQYYQPLTVVQSVSSPPTW